MASLRVLLVCTGNTCRSPMAEGMLRAGARRRGLEVEVVSAGTGAYAGTPATPEAVRVMREEYGVDIGTHRARGLEPDLLAGSDLILTMTREQKAVIQLLASGAAGKVFTLKEFARQGENENLAADIRDPIGQSLEIYRECAAEIAREIEGVLTRLAKGHLIP